MKSYLALPLAALFLLSCKSQKVTQASPENEAVRELEARLGSMEDTLSKLNDALDESRIQRNELEELRAEMARMEKSSKKEAVEISKPVTVVPEPLEEDPQDVRLAAIGESLGTVYTLDGRTFYDARITRVTDVGIEVQHRDGSARLHFSGLAPEIRERFSYVPELARKTLQLERLVQHQRESAILRHTLAQLEEEKERRLEAEKRSREIQASVIDSPIHTTTQVIVDPPIYHDSSSSHVVVERPVIVDQPYCPPTRNVIKPPRVVHTPQPSRPARPTTVPPRTRPVPASPKPAPSIPVVRQPSAPRPSVVRPQAPSRPASPMPSRPAPSTRR
ncbi:hypothetical protein N9Z02_02285 [Akkermansiaceae bacterium]|nr:hypothetical protein [Akkermansiaceae bacterium]